MGVVSKEEFLAFVRVQRSGICNMLDPMIRMIAGLTKEKHLFILEHYAELEKEYEVLV